MTTTATSPRLHMEPTYSKTTLLDGGWWPRTADPETELPAIIEAMTDRRGTVTHALLNPADWSLPHPRRVSAGGVRVRAGWYTSQPAGLLTLVCDFGRDRFDLLVVPPDTNDASATEAMNAAADATNKRHAPTLLADSERH